MKKRFLIFLRKYWFCILLSVIMVVGISLSTRYADLYKTGGLGFDLHDLYLIYVIPLYSFVYGCLSYAILKKIWHPLLILFATTFLYWFIYGIEAIAWEGTYILSVIPVVFSLIGVLITKFIGEIIKVICKNIKAIKNNKNQKP